MIPWVLIDSAPIPGGGELRLLRRGGEFSIMLGGNELMNSRKSGSEEALAQLALAKLKHVAAPQVLIGGLGMGFTLRAALAALPANARVDVAELLQAVLDWARGPLQNIFAGSCDDPRVKVSVSDVQAMIDRAESKYDAILLDVDNGPGGVVRPENDALYNHNGLKAAHAALRQGGVLAIWSAHPDDAFTRRLGRADFVVETVSSRASKNRGARHTLWLATK
ncbi:MAG: spermidine synthase [Caulobacterales bacterium]